MKNLLLSTLFLASAFAAQAQNAMNMQLKSTWTSLPGRTYNDVWGYAANGREYAIIGSNWGTHFVDVTNPMAPVEVGSFAGATQVVNGGVSWRDYKTYGHYAYAVSDGFGNHSMQIFDLSGLPTTVTKVYQDGAISLSAHTVAQENDRLYLINNRTTTSGGARPIDIISLADPVNPTFLATVSLPNFNGMHAIHVRNDTAYCSIGNNGFYIVDLTNPTSPNIVSSITNYPSSGYNHTAWTSGDRQTMLFTDEVPASLPVKVFDISDISNPVLKSTFSTGTFATPHNTFMIDDIAILSYYKDGVQVWDLSNATNPERLGYYDTYPDNDSTQQSYNSPSAYNGAWGTYPYLPSGNILVSDMTYGLFVISPPYPVNAAENTLADQQISVYPNPAKGQFSVRLPENTQQYSIGLFNAVGQQVQTTQATVSGNLAKVNAHNLPAGFYTVRITANGKTYSRKLVLQ